MIVYKIKRHIELDEQYQGVNITAFFYSDAVNLSNEKLLLILSIQNILKRIALEIM